MRRAALLLALAACGGAGGGSDGGDDDAVTPDAAAPPQPGFRAEYFDDYRIAREDVVEAAIDHVYVEDRFSARFTATLEVPVAGTYTFATVADDGVRLRVGDTRVIDDWRGHFTERHEATIELAAGPVAIELEYFEYDLDAELHLYWTAPGEAEALLDASHVVASPATGRAPKPPFANPVIDFDCPDPGVIAAGDAFYALCTGGRFPIRRSYDLVRWEDTGSVVFPDGKPAWAANGGRNWAPEMHVVGDRFVVYYTSVNGANVLSIGAAASDSPTGPFVDRGSPLVEDAQGVIDATYLRDTDGAHYLLYKIDGNAHGAPTPIYLRRLADDGLAFADGSQPVELLRNDSATWEGGVVEAPWIVVEDGTYYLFYSGNVYDGRYRTGVARASSITGPYEKHGDPILGNDDAWVGPGHGSVVRVGELPYFVYHAWHENGSGGHDGARGRVVLVDRIRFEDGWPRISDGTPSSGPQPWPGALE